MTYKIVRMYEDKTLRGEPNVIATGLTLEQAQTHCNDPETSSKTCKESHNVRHTRTYGKWFDAYTEG